MHIWFGNKPFLTASAFSIAPFLDRWARGEGGHWVNMVERFIERKKRQGIKGLRVFSETTDWHDRDDNPSNDHGFFNETRSTSRQMWNYHQLRVQARPHNLTPHHQTVLLKLVELSRKHDIRIEYVVDATLKHSPDLGWLVIGHCIRQVADYLKQIHRGHWVDVREHPEGGMGHPGNDQIHERLRQRFEQVKGPIAHLWAIELHNEADAHSQQVWRNTIEHRQDGTTLEWSSLSAESLHRKAFAEVNAQLKRMRTASHWPEGAVWISQGGNDGHGTGILDYDHRLADAIAFHPERPNMDVGARFDHLLRAARQANIPVYANEIIHGVGDEWWWTVEGEKAMFRPRSSTRQHRARRRFIGEMMEKRMWVCDHTLENMACGFWVENGWQEMPLTEFEEILVSEQGGVEPPPPSKFARYERIIRPSYEQILARAPDEGGLANYNSLMSNGMTESEMRESLIRSDEYNEKNPETE